MVTLKRISEVSNHHRTQTEYALSCSARIRVLRSGECIQTQAQLYFNWQSNVKCDDFFRILYVQKFSSVQLPHHKKYKSSLDSVRSTFYLPPLACPSVFQSSFPTCFDLSDVCGLFFAFRCQKNLMTRISSSAFPVGYALGHLSRT